MKARTSDRLFPCAILTMTLIESSQKLQGMGDKGSPYLTRLHALNKTPNSF